MKPTNTILLLLYLFFTTSTFAQKVKPKALARQQIQTLHDGALFVRLKTSELKITALKNKGKEKEAEEIKLEQEKINQSIVNAFRTRFDFCPVYFFYSNNSTAIKEGNYKGLLFDVNFKMDKSFTSTNYLIAEYDESATTKLNAFVIKNKNYEQLKSPFPYLVKRNEMLVSTQSDEEVVKELNRKLINYYSKQVPK